MTVATVRRTAAAFACASVASLLLVWPAAGHAAGPALGWKAAAHPFALTFLRHGRPLAQQATAPKAGPGGRMAYSLADGSYHQLTKLISQRQAGGGTVYRVATDEPGRTATVAVRHIQGGLHVSWQLAPDSGVAAVFSALSSSAPGEHFLGTGDAKGVVDLTGQLVQLKIAYSCGRSVVTPFFLSSAGYGVYYRTSAVGQIEFRGTHDGMSCDDANSGHPLCPLVAATDRVEACFKASSLAYDVYDGTPTQVLERYRTAAGRMPAPAPAELGVIKWRDRVSGGGEVLDDVRRLHALGFPLTSVLVDNPWETGGCLGSLTFDPHAFPDPKALIAKVHRAGVRFLVWVSPYVTRTPECAGKSSVPAAGTMPGVGANALLDLTSPVALSPFEASIASLARLGVDGFKGDRGDELDLEGRTFAGGPGATVQDQYPTLFARAVLAGARAGGVKRPVTMFRIGSDTSPATGVGVWAGDQTPDFAGMQEAIRSLLTLGASGFALTGSDIGGYASRTGKSTLTPEVFVRWSQLGSISPIFELGGADAAAHFWTLGARATALARQSALLHDALFPYLDGLLQTSARTGAPVLQPLGLAHPADADAWAADLELLLGRDLLAAPVAASEATARVYLPAGSWTDVFTGKPAAGHRTISRAVPLAQFPLYLRSGAAIPFDLRAPLWRKAWPLTAVQVGGRGGWLYAPGAGAVSRSAAGRGSLRASTARGVVHVALRGAPAQSEVLVSLSKQPSSLSIDGRRVRPSPSTAALRQRSSGWVWSPGPYRGALVKLAPGAGAAQLALTTG